jgi:hypothetical protein
MDSETSEPIAETKKYIRDPVLQITAIPVYAAFALLGLIFYSHLSFFLFLFMSLGVLIDNTFVGQTMRSVRQHHGYVSRRDLLRAMLWHRVGLVCVVVGSVVASTSWVNAQATKLVYERHVHISA